MKRDLPLRALPSILAVMYPLVLAAGQPNVVDIANRRELFVDRFLIDRLDGVQLKVHPPQVCPGPSHQLASAYATVIKDGDVYRRYYRDVAAGYKGEEYDGHPGEITCYAESRDGITWVKPNLGLFELNGTRENNAVLAGASPFSHNFCPFLDARPGVPGEQRFKALAGVHKGGGLVAFVSGDGIHWKKLRDEPVIRSQGFAFDSQNASFWSASEGRYVCYFRSWETPHGQLRTISRTTSDDFVNWSPAVATNPNGPGEHLYTSGTHPYFRAPHIYVALPTRFMPDRGDSTDILFMTSRGGNRYERTFMEAFIRPGLDPDRWGNRANYAALNVVPTRPDEMSIYVRDLRYVLRTDGFVSVNAGYRKGEMVTKPLAFKGRELELNFSTSAAGGVRVEIQDVGGKPLPGFALADCPEIVGDKIEHVAAWKAGTDVSGLAGRPVRLRFVMKEADLYSIRFRP